MLNQNIDNPIKALVWDIWNIYEEALKDSEKALALKNSEKEMAVAIKDQALKDILALKESEKEMALAIKDSEKDRAVALKDLALKDFEKELAVKEVQYTNINKELLIVHGKLTSRGVFERILQGVFVELSKKATANFNVVATIHLLKAESTVEG